MRMPSPFLLSQTITLYNRLPADGVPTNGGYPEMYQRTVLRNVRYIQREGAVTASSHGAVSDALNVMIFPSIAVSDKSYVSPEFFSRVDIRDSIWTLQKGQDYIALGECSDETPSIENRGNRNDFKITTVDVLYNPDGSIHHFEVNAK